MSVWFCVLRVTYCPLPFAKEWWSMIVWERFGPIIILLYGVLRILKLGWNGLSCWLFRSGVRGVVGGSCMAR